MRLYKFKSVANIDHCKDIIQNERLYCADWSTLNDPAEGLFFYGSCELSLLEAQNRLEAIRNLKQAIRICSLSSRISSPLLWAHYADGFNGIAIEIDIDPETPEVAKVRYENTCWMLLLDSDHMPEHVGRELLSTKLMCWNHEKEYRILHNQVFYPIEGRIRRVIFGLRLEPQYQQELEQLCALKGIKTANSALTERGKIEIIRHRVSA